MRFTKLFLAALPFFLLVNSISAAATLPSLSSSYLPIPSGSAGPPVSHSLGYRVQSFGDGAYMVTNGVYQGLFFVSCESVIVVDNPPAVGYYMLDAIKNVTSLPISHVVYSHSHADHIGGASILGSPANVTFVAHRQTADILAETPDEKRPAPSITFEDSYNLRVCNQSLELTYMGNNHEPGNIFIWAPVQKIIMLVDIVYPGWVPYYELGLAQNIPGYVKAHEQLLTYDFEHYVGGHLDRSGTREDVLNSQGYVTDLFNATVHAMHLAADSNSSLYAPAIEGMVEKADPGNSWLAVKTSFGVLAEYANNVTNAKWSSKLAGCDVYGITNANVMFESVLIDWGIMGPFGVTNGPSA